MIRQKDRRVECLSRRHDLVGARFPPEHAASTPPEKDPRISGFHATAFTAFGLTSTTFAGITFASHASVSAESSSGVGFTVARTVARTVGGDLDFGTFSNGDFSATAFGNADSQSYLEYMSDDEFTITFESAVSNLSIHPYY